MKVSKDRRPAVGGDVGTGAASLYIPPRLASSLKHYGTELP